MDSSEGEVEGKRALTWWWRTGTTSFQSPKCTSRNVVIGSIEMEKNLIVVTCWGTACLERPPVPVSVLEHRENKRVNFHREHQIVLPSISTRNRYCCWHIGGSRSGISVKSCSISRHWGGLENFHISLLTSQALAQAQTHTHMFLCVCVSPLCL